jgi:hypothetical protein
MDAWRNAVKASSSGHVSGTSAVGGLVGRAGAGIVVNDYSTVTVAASAGTSGGLVGELTGVAIVRSSYFMGSVASNGDAGPIIGSGSTTAVRDTFWVDQPTSGTFQSGGLQRTTTQMRDYDTFSSAGWQIADGWTPAVPWAICPGVKRDSRSLQGFETNPCASLTPSTSVVLAQAGVPITPVSLTASNFSPTAYSITSGSLPAGLTIDGHTGILSGTPAKKSPTRDIVITGSDGSREGRAGLRIGVVRAKPSATNRYSGCETSTAGLVLKVVCSTKGTHAIQPPSGSTLVGIEAVGADGRGSRGRGGAGASASVLDQSSIAHAKDGAYVVTVGSPGTLGSEASGGNLLSFFFDTAYGGGYSSVEYADAAFAPQGLLAGAGGGGGGEYTFFNVLPSCAQIAMALHPLASGAIDYSEQESKAINAQVLWCALAWAGTFPNAGTVFDRLAVAGDWAASASGRQGHAGLLGSLFFLPGAAGKTYVPLSAVVATRPTPASEKTTRPGYVILTFDLSGADGVDVTTAPCSASAPALGELVTCATPGQAQVTVPDEAEVAVVAASGAGGGAAYGSNTLRHYAGGPGAKVTGIVDVSELNSLVARVGGAGASVVGAQHGVSAPYFGEGGGYSGVGPTSTDQVLLAGGGGGGDALSAADTQSGAGGLVMQAMAGKTVIKAGSVLGLPASSSGAGPNGGVQGQSWQMTALVSQATFDSVGGGAGATEAASGTVPEHAANNGLVTLRFCGRPGAPSVTSVTGGTSAGQATVDVAATAPTNTGGCEPTKYQFRTSAAMEWADAPGLTFPIVYDLAGGQTVCVQMQAQNPAGWSPPSAYSCGTASDAAATAPATAPGAVAGGDIVISANGTVSPTTLTSVGNGGTFTLENQSSSFATVTTDPDTAMTVGGSSCAQGCNVASGSTATVTLVAGGPARIYVEAMHAITNITVN